MGRKPNKMVPFYLSISLIVRCPKEVHDQVGNLLRGLRVVMDARDARMVRPDPTKQRAIRQDRRSHDARNIAIAASRESNPRSSRYSLLRGREFSNCSTNCRTKSPGSRWKSRRRSARQFFEESAKIFLRVWLQENSGVTLVFSSTPSSEAVAPIDTTERG